MQRENSAEAAPHLMPLYRLLVLTGLLPFLLGALLVAGPYLIYNQNIYGDWFPPYARASRVGDWNSFWIALPANLFSPARGLLVFSPVVAFAVVGVSLLVLSRFGHWWLGHSFGPRGMTDVLPFLFWFLIPVLNAVDFRRRARTVPRLALAAGLLLSGLWSLEVHHRGANQMATMLWNVEPRDVDRHPERIRDWSNPQVLSGIECHLPGLEAALDLRRPECALP